LKSSCLIKRCS